MKRFLLLLALLAACTAQAQRYTNPVLHLDYSDPDVCRVGDRYYMTASSFNCFPGLPILESDDLVHWELTGAALWDYEPAFREDVEHGNGVWAPAIRYHDGWFYIYVGDPDRGIFMVRSRNPRGRWSEPVWVVREKGFIDPCPFWDEDGKAYLSHGCAGSRATHKSVVFVAPLSADGTCLEGPSRIAFDGHLTQPTIEGTKFYKRGEWYYIFAPAGGVATGWQTVLRSASPWGPWEERIVMAWAPGTINGPHQGAWVSAPDGTDWFLHFQDKGAYGRILHLQPLTWRADGWPLIGEDPDADGVGQPVKAWKAPASTPLRENAEKRVTPCLEEQGITQNEAKMRNGVYGLPLEWQYPTVPSPYWHYALPGGGIRLYSVIQKDPEANLWNCPNLLLQKFPAEEFTVTARLTFMPNPALKREQAGFLVQGDDYAGLRLTDTPEGAQLDYISCLEAPKGNKEQVTVLTMLPYTLREPDFPYASGNVPAVKYPTFRQTEIWVRLTVKPRAVKGNVPDAVCHFSYSPDGKHFKAVNQEFIAKPELWIGAKFGFFCNRPVWKNDGGWVDIQALTIQ